MARLASRTGPLRAALATAGFHLVPLALLAAAACLTAGVSLPILHVRKLWVFEAPFSILDGVRALAGDGDWLLAGIILAFSIVFPLLKMSVLLVLWWRLRWGGRPPSVRAVALLQALGKWSMLDVFVVALTIFAVKASAFADADVAAAVYPFLAAIALTASCGRIVAHACGRRRPAA